MGNARKSRLGIFWRSQMNTSLRRRLAFRHLELTDTWVMQSSWKPQVMKDQIQDLPPALEHALPNAEQQKRIWHSFLSINGVLVFDCCCICC